MSYIQGQIIEVPFTIVDTDTSDPVDPTSLHFLIKGPDDVITDLEYPADGIARLAVGSFVGSWTADQAGRYRWRAVSTGAGQGALQGYVDVEEAFAVSYAPQVEDVAALLPRRTIDGSSNQIGSFTDDTSVTDVQVAAIIDQAVQAVGTRLPTILDARNTSTARWLTTLYAAMLVELTYFPEQIPDQSPFEQYKSLYDDGIQTLISNTLDNQPGGYRFGSLRVGSPTRPDGWEWCEDEQLWA
jgi:hypothetical protein